MSTYSIIVHGGAWAIPDSLRDGCLAGCRRAAECGAEILASGGSSLDAVVAAVKILEDDPHFGAGYGSSLNADGHVETDSMIMDGATLGLGAVAAVQRVKNPIILARAVMEKTPHTFLVGAGATRFAEEAGVQMVSDPSELISPYSQEEYEGFRRRREQDGYSGVVGAVFGNGPKPKLEEENHQRGDTVGCVAIDQSGRIVAGTSTGGVPSKRPGRVGDSPLIGCGGFADLDSGVSTTGHGESLMKVMLAKEVATLIEAGVHPHVACKRGLEMMARKVKGSGGVISLSRKGVVGFDFTTPRMAYAYVEHGKPLVAGIDLATDRQTII